jgi:hypothetical protein
MVAACRRETDREVGFADTGRPDQQHVGGGLDVAAGAELVDQLAVDAGLGIEVEVVQCGWCGQAGETQAAHEASCLRGVDFDREQPLECRCHRQLLGGGFVEDAWQRFGAGVEFQHGEMSERRV